MMQVAHIKKINLSMLTAIVIKKTKKNNTHVTTEQQQINLLFSSCYVSCLFFLTFFINNGC